MNDAELQQGRRAAAWDGFVVLVTLASLVLIAWVEFEGLAHGTPLYQRLALVDLGMVLILAVDFAARWRAAPDRWAFFKSNWWEVLGMVPLYADAFSWMRLTRLARIARLLRLIRVVSLSRRWRAGAEFLDVLLFRHQLGPAILASIAIVLSMAGVVWLVERDVNPTFYEFHDALWWATVTATTVGYGDLTPQTGLGRFLAGGLMLVGIGMIGILSSSLSATLMRTVGARYRRDRVEGEPVTADESLVDSLERLARLHEEGHLSSEEFALAKQRVLELKGK